MQQSFETHQPIELLVQIGRGRVTLEAHDTAETTVWVTGTHAEEVEIAHEGDRISVIAPKIRTGFFGGEPDLTVTVTLPHDSDIAVRTGSADVTATGRYAAAQVKSGSGDVELEHLTGPATAETGSGDVRVHIAGAELRIKSGSGDIGVGVAGSALAIVTGSGDIEVGTAAGPTVIKTGSGDLRVATADGDLSMSTGSGDSRVSRFNRGRFTVKGASGDVAVGIPAGVPVWTDISSIGGTIRSDLVGAGQPAEGQDYVELLAKSVSGDIVLTQL
jgi:DUF4097 and DUF4098 domain-containing protein YvlB